MAQSTSLGDLGLMFGLLGVIISLTGIAQNLGLQYSYVGPLVWALIAWGVGLAFVIGERFEAMHSH